MMITMSIQLGSALILNDKYKFHRDFKVYQAEKYDENHQVIPQALTPHGNTKYIMVNPQWEYFKAKARKSLSKSTMYSPD